MKILLIAATKAELAIVFEHFELPQQDFVQHAKFDILITGVGLTATAFALGKTLNSSYNLALNVGIAGSFNSQIALGSLVNIETDRLADFGAEDHDNFLTIDDLGLGNSSYQATYKPTEPNILQLPKVSGITVNTAHGNAQSIAKTIAKYNPATESMEGAAVFYACLSLQVPCLQIRSISNYVTPRNKLAWQIELALKNLNLWLIDYLENLETN